MKHLNIAKPLATYSLLFLLALNANAKHPEKPKVSAIEACQAAHTFLQEWNGRGDFYIISAEYIHNRAKVAPYWLIQIADSNLDSKEYLKLYVGMDMEYSIVAPSE
jgi:hypothetical protein